MDIIIDAIKSFKEFIQESYNIDTEFIDKVALVDNKELEIKITPNHIWKEFISGKSLVRFLQHDGSLLSYEVGFKIDGGYDLTNTQGFSAQKLIATCVNGLIKELKKLDPQTFYFTVHEPRRNKFYDAMLKTLQKYDKLPGYERSVDLENTVSVSLKEILDIDVGVFGFVKS